MSEQTFTVEIKEIHPLTHDVKRFKVEKPEGYSFVPGQATEVSINSDEWREKKRPFTFTNLPGEGHLEFVIKSYHDHDGVTKQIDKLAVGDEFIIGESWGAISYQGPGYFIAGGAGITPFIAIFKKLYKEGKIKGNHLIFSNKTSRDVILQNQWESWLGENFLSTITHEKSERHLNEFIDKNFLKKHIDQFNNQFYICGPQKMVEDISVYLKELGADPNGIIFEK